ncbi:MAG: DNA gyrase subunit A [Dysosmobacter sp.]
MPPAGTPRQSWPPSARELFRDLDCDAVDFVDNYDNTMKEPSLLPTTFPNVLVSANQGIAVGMASQHAAASTWGRCATPPSPC